jgi:tetratricopeptide (TPR) repeat protein
VTIAAYIALFGWIPAVVVLYALLPARLVSAVAVIGAWLLLPPYSIPISNFPDYSKNTAASIAMLLGTLLFAPGRVLRFRPRYFDLPMLGWCLCGIASSLQNGLGLYDGLSDALRQFLYWGLPYVLGRLYFSDVEGLRVFTVAMVFGGLAYVLPCLWEVRMSPNLLEYIYGSANWQGTRLGGYRPHVFFNTGLECGMWMTAASLTAWWLWRCGILTKIGGISFGRIWLPILLGTTLLCRSTGALVLLALGIGVLWASTRYRTRALLLALVLFEPVYVGLRIPNLWSGHELVRFIKDYFNADRAQSLEYRFNCENLLIVKAIEQPVFGWGGWDRSRVYFDDEYRDEYHVVPTDGLWIITLGTKGYVGLILFYLALELPVILFLWRFPATMWRIPGVGPAALAATLLGLYMIDCTMNGFVNIIYVSLAGAIITMAPTQLRINPHPISGRVLQRTLPLGSEALAAADRYRSLGRSLKSEGRFAQAQVAWRQALDILTRQAVLYPADSDLQRRWCDCANDLAWLLLNHPDPDLREPTLALALARRVVEKCSDSSAYWNTLGVAYFRTGDFETAISALDCAIVLGDGGSSFDHIFLAMAHARLGNQEESRRYLAHAMFQKEKDYPTHPELARFCDEAQSISIAGPDTGVVAG